MPSKSILQWEVRFRNKGATAEEKSLQSQQAEFYKTLTADYNQQFAKQNAIIDSLKSTWEPILKAGSGQFGLGKEEETALRTQAKEGTAQSYDHAKKALGEQIATIGGGDTLLPSGAVAQIEGELASRAAESEASKQLGITTEGYKIGRENFMNASAALGSTAGLVAPTSYISGTNTAGSDAFSSAHTINEEDTAGSFGAIAGGLLGGAINSFAGSFGGGLGTSVAKKVGGGH